ncbi:MAG: Sec-independent protein translocase TatB [Microbacteriaceae bacterium]
MFGLTFEKLVIIAVIAGLLLGPQRLPYYASQLARLTRSLRDLANGAKERMREEMGDEFQEVDWKKLDPRQYDPRRIIREALLDDSSEQDAPPQLVRPAGSAEADAAEGDAAEGDARAEASSVTAGPPPFDAEAT